MNKKMTTWLCALMLMSFSIPTIALGQDEEAPSADETPAASEEEANVEEEAASEEEAAPPADEPAEPEEEVAAPAVEAPAAPAALPAPMLQVAAPTPSAAKPAPKDERLRFKARATSSVHGLENLDFRDIDETSDRAILDTDDRRLFGHSDIVATLGYRASERSFLNLQVKYDAIWKDEQLGRTEGSTGDLNFYQLNLVHFLSGAANNKGECAEKGTCIRLVVGRQPFQIGGLNRDYMLKGSIDGVTLDFDLDKNQKLRVLLVDFFGGNSLPETGYHFYRDGRQTVYNLRGETTRELEPSERFGR